MLITTHTQDLIEVFNNGGVFAYPTEAIYGLGCDPDNAEAVKQLLRIKNRNIEKGLILIAADFSQVQKYLKPLNETQKEFTAPSDTTYVFPALDSVPEYLKGEFSSLAIRISKHPIVQKLCSTLDSALVSTSANLSGQPPAKNFNEASGQFSNKIDAILKGETGELLKPTAIRDSITGQLIRSQ